MPISSFSNPITDIISGLLQGHQLATQMHKQQQDDQAFKTDQILKNQKISSDAIMQQMQDATNQDWLGQHAQPISAMGTVSSTAPAGPDIPNPVPGMPATPGNPAFPNYQTKADPSRTITYQGQKHQLYTREEQQQQAADQETAANGRKATGAEQIKSAQLRAQATQTAIDRKNELALMPNGGIDAPAGIESYGYQKGEKMTHGEAQEVRKQMQSEEKPIAVPQGATLYQRPDPFTQAGTPTPQGQPAQPADPNQTTLSMPGLTLPGQTTPAPQTGAQTGTPTPGGLQVVGQGGPKKLNDQESYVEASAQAIGKTTKDLTGTEKLKFITQYKHDPEIQLQQQQNHEETMGIQRQAHQDTLAAQQRTALDHETALHGKAFDEISKGADAQLDKILDAEKMVSGGAVQQALAIPKVLTAVISGNGSGVRITKSEMDSIAKARGLGGDIEGWFNKLSGQGSLSTQQKAQLQSVLGDVRERIMQKKAIARQASDEVMNAPDRAGVLSAVKRGRDALDGQQGGAKPGNPNPNGYVKGHVYGNLTYLGGDPNSQSSWKQ
jgi:hypothetical protein